MNMIKYDHFNMTTLILPNMTKYDQVLPNDTKYDQFVTKIYDKNYSFE